MVNPATLLFASMVACVVCAAMLLVITHHQVAALLLHNSSLPGHRRSVRLLDSMLLSGSSRQGTNGQAILLGQILCHRNAPPPSHRGGQTRCAPLEGGSRWWQSAGAGLSDGSREHTTWTKLQSAGLSVVNYHRFADVTGRLATVLPDNVAPSPPALPIAKASPHSPPAAVSQHVVSGGLRQAQSSPSQSWSSATLSKDQRQQVFFLLHRASVAVGQLVPMPLHIEVCCNVISQQEGPSK